MMFDSTGMFHWCPSRNLNDSLMDRQEAAMTVLQVGTKHFWPNCLCSVSNDTTIKYIVIHKNEISSMFQDHVIVAVFADEDSPLIGLRNLVMPLRASNVPYTALLQVVLVGNVEYIRRMY